MNRRYASTRGWSPFNRILFSIQAELIVIISENLKTDWLKISIKSFEYRDSTHYPERHYSKCDTTANATTLNGLLLWSLIVKLLCCQNRCLSVFLNGLHYSLRALKQIVWHQGFIKSAKGYFIHENMNKHVLVKSDGNFHRSTAVVGMFLLSSIHEVKLNETHHYSYL